MGSSAPASPPPPSAGGLCLPPLAPRGLGGGQGSPCAGARAAPCRMLQGSRGQRSACCIVPEAAARRCSAQPYPAPLPTWREAGALLGELPGILTLPAPSVQGERGGHRGLVAAVPPQWAAGAHQSPLTSCRSAVPWGTAWDLCQGQTRMGHSTTISQFSTPQSQTCPENSSRSDLPAGRTPEPVRPVPAGR